MGSFATYLRLRFQPCCSALDSARFGRGYSTDTELGGLLLHRGSEIHWFVLSPRLKSSACQNGKSKRSPVEILTGWNSPCDSQVGGSCDFDGVFSAAKNRARKGYTIRGAGEYSFRVDRRDLGGEFIPIAQRPKIHIRPRQPVKLGCMGNSWAQVWIRSHNLL